jgi:hypothetical protein
MGILDDLLARGYLPVQLPPAFSSSTFASELPAFESAWSNGKPPATLPSKYSVARSSFYRRHTALVNPIGFFFLAKEVATYWPQIEKHYQKSSLSRSVPTFAESLRAIRLKKFSELHEEKITSAAGFKYALITDITSFFPTIYTHAIPWALHTKARAKVERTKSARYFGNILDDKCMGLQDRQTIGLPIGPDTSHIIAEIIAVAIDQQFEIEFGHAPDGFRYVDDFFLFFGRHEDAEKALAILTRTVGRFELQLNAAKTRIIEVKALVEESWKYSMKKLVISADRRQQRNDIHHYFEFMFSLEQRAKDESLVKYGLKRISSKIVKKSNWPVFEAYLLKCGFSFPNTIQVLAHILATYRHHDYALNIDAIARFCNTLIPTAAGSDHHGEVSWLLWICKELGIDVGKEGIKAVLGMGNAVCTLILLDMKSEGIIKAALDRSSLRQYAVAEALTGPDWILAYEGGRREWLGNTNDKFIGEHHYFGPLNDAGVVFYDDEKRLPPIFEFKEAVRKSGTPFDFDTDVAIEENFKFDDMDEEYFDSAESQDENADSEDNDDGEDDEDSETDF